MEIPEPVEAALSRLRDGGFRALLAGGCVRDWLLGVQPKDWDVATDALPEQVLALLDGAQTVGAHFGVVLWRGVEVATFRGDGAYSDGRRPDSVRSRCASRSRTTSCRTWSSMRTRWRAWSRLPPSWVS